jgi:hypothetical protein
MLTLFLLLRLSKHSCWPSYGRVKRKKRNFNFGEFSGVYKYTVFFFLNFFFFLLFFFFFLFFCLSIDLQGSDLRAFTADAAGQLDVLAHDSDALRVDGAQISVFKKGNQIGFRSLLKSQDRSALEAKIVLKILGDFTNQALERQLADQEVS